MFMMGSVDFMPALPSFLIVSKSLLSGNNRKVGITHTRIYKNNENRCA